MVNRGLAALAFLAAVTSASPASSDVSFEFQAAFGGFGIGRESFDLPVDVVQDREENIYVVDQRNNRIQVLDRRGNYVREWGGRGVRPGDLDTPAAIAIDRDSRNLFVVDKLNHRVQKFDLKGKFLMSIGRLGSSKGDLNAPTDVALDKKGDIYVADTGNNRIQKFDPSGRFISEWGKFARQGRGAILNRPASVAYSEEGFGYIYVLNSEECRVLKFETDGTFVAEWPMHRKGEGALCGPSRIRIEPRKYTVYIADTENNRVVLFDRNGELMGELKEGKVPFRMPGGIYISNLFGEEVIVADTKNNLIQKFRRER